MFGLALWSTDLNDQVLHWLVIHQIYVKNKGMVTEQKLEGEIMAQKMKKRRLVTICEIRDYKHLISKLSIEKPTFPLYFY